MGAGTNYKPRRSRSVRDLSEEVNDSKSQRGVRSFDTKYAKQTGLTEAEWEETMKRLRRLVLLEGVPGDDVSRMNSILFYEEIKIDSAYTCIPIVSPT